MASQATLGTATGLPVRCDSPLVYDETAAGRRPARIRFLRAVGGIFQTLPTGSWVLLDVCLLLAGTTLGFRLFVDGRILPYLHVGMWQAGGILAMTYVFASLVFGVFERETLYARSRILTRLVLTTLAAAVLTYAVVYVAMYTTVSRRVVAVAIGVFVVGGGAARLFACWALHSIRRGLLIVGPGIVSNSLVRAFKEGFLGEYVLAGYVDDSDEGNGEIDGVPWLGGTAQLPALCRRHGVHDIVVGAEAATDARVMNAVLPCLRTGCRITNEATFYEKATGQIPVDEINPHWFLFADLQVHCQRRQALKRAFDLIATCAGLILTAPLAPIIALLIKLDDGGPVLYSQERVGQNWVRFTLYKFRTMKPDAEPGRPQWAVKRDPRVTRVGRLLRKTRLDELPQLYNVLVGDMSLVGPRPERPEFVEELARSIPYFNERHLVKPGLTGWAQINFHYTASVADARRKLQFDLYYVKNMSLELDLMILLRTLGVFLRGAC